MSFQERPLRVSLNASVPRGRGGGGRKRGRGGRGQIHKVAARTVMGAGSAPRAVADGGLQGRSRGLRFKATKDWESRRFRWRRGTEVRQQMAATFDRLF